MKTAPTTPIERDPERLNEILPWYLNGSLSEDDRTWVEAQIGRDARAAADLRFDEATRSALQARADELPADLGWEKLLGRVRTDSAQASTRGEPSRAALSRQANVRRDGGWLARLFSPRLGMALAVLLAVQTVGIGLLWRDEGADTAEYRSGAALAPSPVLRAMVADGVTEQRLRAALAQQGLRIVDGPTQMGEYLLFGGDADLERAGAALKNEGILVAWSLDTKVIAR